MANIQTNSLARTLTLVPATALLVTNVIGVGVFMKARVMTCNVGSPWLVLLAYALAGVFTIAGALTFAELGALMPRAGGMYNFIGAAFGRIWAFLYGWVVTLIDAAASNAALAIVFAIFFNDVIGATLPPWESKLVAVGAIVSVTLLGLAPVRTNGHFATVLTILKVTVVAGIGLAAFAFGDGSMGHFAESGAAGTCENVEASARLGLAGFGAAIVGALWSFTGWSIVTYVAEEVRTPEKTLPRALISGSVILTAIYLLANAGYFYVLTPEEVASVPESSSVAGQVLIRLIGAGGVALMAAGLMASSFGSMHAGMVTQTRMAFAMARDGLLPKSLANISERARVPTHAVVLVGTCAIAFALSGTFDVITDLVVFVLLLFNGLAVASIYVLRRKLPDVPRPYRMWGYPFLPALYLGATLYLMINTLLATPGRALAGIGIVALGLPVYFYYARRLPEARLEDWLAPPKG
jgi:APA family basic amino acid/polyamine antiporter